MKVRKAIIDDIDRCLEILQDDMLLSPDNNYISDKDWLIEFLDEYFLVLEENEKIIGCFLANNIFKDGVYIWYIVIDPNFRAYRKISYFIKEIKTILKNNNKTWTFFTSGLKNDNFYKRKGFVTNDKIVKEYYGEI